MCDEVAFRGFKKNSFFMLLKNEISHDSINYYQPFDKYSTKWFNALQHHVALNILNVIVVNTYSESNIFWFCHIWVDFMK